MKKNPLSRQIHIINPFLTIHNMSACSSGMYFGSLLQKKMDPDSYVPDKGAV